MILPLVLYDDPVLRKKGAEIEKITDEHRKLAHDMLETMHKNNGLGLAAQQVGHPLQITVLDVVGSERPSQLFHGVKEVRVESVMPMVLVNPVISKPRGKEIGIEGCLSFPGVSLEITRAHEISVEALDLEGRKQRFTCTGLLARAIQHEIDHLNGVLFIDRADSRSLEEFKPQLDELQKKSKRRGST